MKLINFNYECGNCGEKFKSPELLGNPYGEFMMRSSKGDIAYLYALNNTVFKEFGDMLELNPLISKMKSTEQAKILHRVFGWACDLSSDGGRYEITQKPPCPFCKECNIKYWGPTNPPEYIDLDIKPITHESWDRLTESEKLIVVDKALTSYFNKKDG